MGNVDPVVAPDDFYHANPVTFTKSKFGKGKTRVGGIGGDRDRGQVNVLVAQVSVKTGA